MYRETACTCAHILPPLLAVRTFVSRNTYQCMGWKVGSTSHSCMLPTHQPFVCALPCLRCSYTKCILNFIRKRSEAAAASAATDSPSSSASMDSLLAVLRNMATSATEAPPHDWQSRQVQMLQAARASAPQLNGAPQRPQRWLGAPQRECAWSQK